MRTNALGILLAGVVVTLAGCATGEEWTTWKQHPSHVASGEHLFSVRNAEGRAPTVVRRDVAAASTEGWWGKTITVSQEQIMGR